MKKKIFLCLILLFISTIFLFAETAKVINISGRCEYSIDNGVKFLPLKKDMDLNVNTVISTGFRSSVTLKFGESVLYVDALSKVTIEELKSQSIVLNLSVGKLNNNVKPMKNQALDYKVKTPVVTASVRGTKFDITAEGKVEVFWEEGEHKVIVFNNITKQETIVDKGQIYIYNSGNPVEIPQNKNTIEKDSMENAIYEQQNSESSIITVVN